MTENNNNNNNDNNNDDNNNNEFHSAYQSSIQSDKYQVSHRYSYFS